MTFEAKLYHAALAGWGFAVGELLWYALGAGGLWLLFDVLLRPLVWRRRIVQRLPAWAQVSREVLCSLRSVLVFGLVTGLVVYLEMHGLRSRVYGRGSAYGWGWYFGSIAVAVLIHDAYFYWTHRLLHHPLLFRRFHREHHLSHNPTPWAAYRFSTGEALVQAGIGPLLVYTVPMHYSAFLAFMLWQIAFNVFGHCGYEIFPRWFFRCGAGRILNTVTHHAMHHEKVGANFGLYFNVWDRLLGTNHAEYERRFDEVTAPDRREAVAGEAAAG